MIKPSKQDISRIIPNTFPMPNWYVDSGLWALLEGDEQACLVPVVRKTFGWWKTSDHIALSQISEMAGIPVPSARRVMKKLVAFGLVTLLSDVFDGNPAGLEWGLQTDDQFVDYHALRRRADAKDKLNKARMAKVRPLLLDSTPTVRQQGTPTVRQQDTPTVRQQAQNHVKTVKTSMSGADKKKSTNKRSLRIEPDAEATIVGFEKLSAQARAGGKAWKGRHFFDHDDRLSTVADKVVALFGVPMKSDLHIMLSQVQNLVTNNVLPSDLQDAYDYAKQKWTSEPIGLSEGLIKLARTRAIQRLGKEDYAEDTGRSQEDADFADQLNAR